MFRRPFTLLEFSYKARLTCDVHAKNSILQTLARGNTTLSLVNQPTKVIPFLCNRLQDNIRIEEIKFPKPSNLYSRLEISFPTLNNLIIEHKQLPSIYSNVTKTIDQSKQTDHTHEVAHDFENGGQHIYWMGSLLKKRRRKMNRQKYKKRRKRDRFKREALKNLRERKRQRKERAAERKQAILSKMVVNKSISKRRARYLSHKLLPGVIKGQSLG